ncbi:MAG: ATP-binding protein [Bdellovibrionota bacterium]
MVERALELIDDFLAIGNLEENIVSILNSTARAWLDIATTIPFDVLINKIGANKEKIEKKLEKGRALKIEVEINTSGCGKLPAEFTIREVNIKEKKQLIVHGRNMSKVAEKDAMLKSISAIIDQNNKILKKQKKEIKDILDNMRQAIFAIDNNLKVKPPVSAYAFKIFNRDITGEPILDLLLKDYGESSDMYALAKTSLQILIGSGDSFQWLITETNLPKYIKYNNDNDQKDLKISYSPIYDTDGIIEQILFIVEDISEVKRLEIQLESEKKATSLQNAVLEIVAKHDHDFLQNFFESSQELLLSIKSKTQNIDNHEDHSECYRFLHTIKGNARALSLELISSQVHHAEESLQSLKLKFDDQILTQFQSNINKVDSVLDEHITFYKRIFKDLDSQTKNSTRVHNLRINEILKRASDPHLYKDSNKIKQLVAEIYRLEDIAAIEAFDYLFASVQKLANSLDKKIDFKISANDCFLNKDLYNKLRDIINHIIRNAIDHGIEHPQERLKKGKNEIGNIDIIFRESFKDGLQIEIKDDGKGLDITNIKKKAQQSGIDVSTIDVLDLIFLDGLSTSQQVTDLSGRGVGMSAVKKIVSDLGGAIQTHTETGLGTTFTIMIPMPTIQN